MLKNLKEIRLNGIFDGSKQFSAAKLGEERQKLADATSVTIYFKKNALPARDLITDRGCGGLVNIKLL